MVMPRFYGSKETAFANREGAEATFVLLFYRAIRNVLPNAAMKIDHILNFDLRHY